MAKYNFNNLYMQRKDLTDSADKVTIKSSSLNKIYAKNGNDKITVSGGMCVNNKIYGGDGNDTITIKKKVYAHNTIIRGGAGKDKITVNGLQNAVRIYGEAGNDTIIVAGETRTKSGASSYVSTFAGAYKIDGGKGVDKITVKGGSEFKISGGSGNDTIEIYGGQNHVVKGGTGNDKMTAKDVKSLSNGGNNSFDGGAGDDTITVWQNSATVKGGIGNDKIFIKRGGLNNVDAGSGKDTITVSGGTNTTVLSGSGNDTLAFCSTFTGTCTVKDYSGGDIFKFIGVGWNQTDYSIDGTGDVTLNLSNGGKIYITGASGKTLSYEMANGTKSSVKFV